MDTCKHTEVQITGGEQLGYVTCVQCGCIIPVSDAADFFLSQLRTCMDVMSRMHSELNFNPMEGI